MIKDLVKKLTLSILIMSVQTGVHSGSHENETNSTTDNENIADPNMNRIESVKDDQTENESPKEEVQYRINDAEQKISEAEKRINKRYNEGFDVGAAAEILNQAVELLYAAKTEVEFQNYKTAKEFAAGAKHLAEDASSDGDL